GDTITVTIDDARGRWCMQADAFDDVVASPLDETTSNDGSSSALSTGTTGTTSTPHQLLYAVFGFGGGRDVTVPEGWTGADKLETSAGSGNRALQVTHRYVAATGAYEATLTLSTSSTYAAAMGTYEIVPPDPEARLSQLRIQAPNPGEAKLARLSQLALVAPQAKIGEARLSQLRIEAPAGEGQPYTGLKIARDGAWWNAGVHAHHRERGLGVAWAGVGGGAAGRGVLAAARCGFHHRGTEGQAGRGAADPVHGTGQRPGSGGGADSGSAGAWWYRAAVAAVSAACVLAALVFIVYHCAVS